MNVMRLRCVGLLLAVIVGAGSWGPATAARSDLPSQASHGLAVNVPASRQAAIVFGVLGCKRIERLDPNGPWEGATFLCGEHPWASHHNLDLEEGAAPVAGLFQRLFYELRDASSDSESARRRAEMDAMLRAVLPLYQVDPARVLPELNGPGPGLGRSARRREFHAGGFVVMTELLRIDGQILRRLHIARADWDGLPPRNCAACD